MLAIDSVHVAYGRVPALVDVSLEMKAGELVALVGPNGAGKTTLAKMIAGFVRPSSGTVTFEGRRIDRDRPDKLVRQGVRLCLEGHRVFPEISVRDNIRLGQLALTDASRFADRVDEVYDLFPVLREKAAQPARDLSGGQQQLLALAQAFVGNPKLLICDEPSLGVAQRLIPEIMSALRRLTEQGVAVIVIEQVLAPALEVADRVLVMNHGGIVGAGTPSEFTRERLRELFLGKRIVVS